MHLPTKFYLLRRNNGIYYIGYRQHDRRCWKFTRSRRKSDALKALTQLRDLLTRTLRVPLLSEYTAEYASQAGSRLSPRTVVGYRAALRSFLGFVGDRPVSAITQRDIDGYIAHRLQRIKPTTVNIELRSLRAAFGTAVKWGVIEANPFANVKLVRIPEEMPVFMSRESLQILLSAIREDWLREIVVFAVTTGMRRGEILNLRWSQVDLQRRLIQVQSSGDFKTKHGRRRSIPINGAAHSILSAKFGRSF